MNREHSFQSINPNSLTNKPTGRRYKSVADLLVGEGLPVSVLQEYSKLFERDYGRVSSAALALYNSGCWYCDELPIRQQRLLWESLRDALHLKPGTATKAGVAPKSGNGMVPLPKRLRGKVKNGGVECDMSHGPCACGGWH